MKIFGFEFGKRPIDKDQVSPIPKDHEAAIQVESMPYGGIQSFAMDLSGYASNENAMIDKCREIATLPEVDRAIEEIVSDAIIGDEDRAPVIVKLDRLELPDKIKEIIDAEFRHVLNLLHFRTKGYDIFRRWYIDGRIYYHLIIDSNAPFKGIREIRYIDPKKIKRVRESIKKDGLSPTTEQIMNKEYIEYYLYNENGVDNGSPGAVNTITGAYTKNIQIAKDSISYCNSGMFDSTNIPLSFLQKAVRPANNLRLMEDSLVIYRIARAPERRIFYIDVGNLQKGRAEQYMQQIMTKYKNKLVYDAKTGEIKDDRKHMAMTEDYWIPRREGSTGTVIDTLAGGENLGVLEDVQYFKNKLLESLNVPIARFSDQPSIFNSGTDITREELRFARFISRLRSKFSELLADMLGKQLVLKNIMSLEFWEAIRESVFFDFVEDNYFSEQMQTQVMMNRVNLAAQIQPFIGHFFSKDYVYKNVFHLSEMEVEEIQLQIQQEIAMGELPDPSMMASGPNGDQIQQPEPPEGE